MVMPSKSCSCRVCEPLKSHNKLNNMKNLICILFTLITLTYGFQCDEEECDSYIFDTASLDYSIKNYQTAFEIGDTISIEYQNGNLVMLHETMKEIDLKNTIVYQYFDLFEVKENNSPITSGTKDIQIIHNGSSLDTLQNTNEITRLIAWNCIDINCLFSLKLIPQKSGFYGIRLLHGLLAGEPICEEYEFKENTFNISSNNFEILNEINTTEIKIDVPINFDEATIPEGSFYFKVK